MGFKKSVMYDYIGNRLSLADRCKCQCDKEFMLGLMKLTKNVDLLFEYNKSFNYDFEFLKEISNIYSENAFDVVAVLKECNTLKRVNKDTIDVYIAALKNLKNLDDNDRFFLESNVNNYLHYLSKLFQKEAIKQGENGRFLGMGFCFADDYLKDCRAVMELLSVIMLENIISDFSFESCVHKKFKTKTELKEYGYNKFIIEEVFKKDTYLADFISLYPELLEHVSYEFNLILTNWKDYDLKITDIINDNLSKFCDVYEMNFDLVKGIVGKQINVYGLKVDENVLNNYEDSLSLLQRKALKSKVEQIKSLLKNNKIGDLKNDNPTLVSNVVDLSCSTDYILEKIKLTGDVKYYDECALSLKMNIEFIKKVIFNLRNKPNDVYDIISNLFIPIDKELYQTELLIFASNYVCFDKSIEKDNADFLNTISSTIMNRCKNFVHYNKVYGDYGYGFEVVIKEFSEYPLLVEFMAQKFIRLFVDKNDFEFLCHSQFNSKNEFKASYKKFLYEKIDCTDHVLGEYLKEKNHLFDCVRINGNYFIMSGIILI